MPALSRCLFTLLLLGGLVVSGACSSPQAPGSPPTTPAPTDTAEAPQVPADGALPETPSPFDALPPAARQVLDKPFTGDLDEMVARRVIRAGVAYSRTHYFIDKGVQRGLAYDSLKLFEDQLNARLKTGNLKVHVVFVTLPRDQMLPALLAGKVDLVAATLTITPERQRLVAFSTPTRANVSEIVVTGPSVAPIATVDDLSGRTVFVRRSSSYFDALQPLNARLAAAGKAPIRIREAPEVFEDDDILEMVNAGLVEATIAQDYAARFWKQVWPDLQLHEGAAVRTGAAIGVAMRKSNPRLLRAANTWVEEYGPRSAFGNMMERRYLLDTAYARGATNEAERRKFRALVDLFRKYGQQYDLDYLLMAAQGYQESQLDHDARSRVGAIGVMQVMPATGRELAVGDIRQLEPNIHAGVKYIRFMMDRYFENEPMDRLNKGLMTFAAYNAGPGRIRRLREEAAKRGLDPNVWFGNVEAVASERIGRETVQYVSNIYKYYVAYRMAMDEQEQQQRAAGALPVDEPKVP